MLRPRLLVPLLTALVLAPVTATAQSPVVRLDAIDRTDDDLGTWDALIAGVDAHGRPFTSSGVEVNTRGCHGRCIETRVGGGLRPDVQTALHAGTDRPAAWWDIYDGDANRGRVVDPRSGIPSGVAGEVTSAPFPGATSQRPTSVFVFAPPSRTSVEYPDKNHRVLAVYGRGGDGREHQLLRIVYTRRQ